MNDAEKLIDAGSPDLDHVKDAVAAAIADGGTSLSRADLRQPDGSVVVVTGTEDGVTVEAVHSDDYDTVGTLEAAPE